MSHDHHHSETHRPTPERALWVAIALNGAFLVIEAAAGWLTGSLALLSDAGHMVSDVGALAIALVALRISTSKPSDAWTFGLRRAPVLGALVNGAALVAIVVLIGIEAARRFGEPPEVDAWPVIAVGIIGLGVNLASAWYLARSRDESVNTRGAMLHLLSDALGSVAAIVAGVATLTFGFTLADPIASVVIALLILGGSWPLLRDTVGILLQRAPSGVNVHALREQIATHPDVVAIEDLHVWAIDSGQNVLSAMLVVDAVELSEANAIADRIRVIVHETGGVEHATIECRHVAASRGPVCR